MIRSNVPLPLLFRLRLRANWVARRAQSKLTTYRQRSGSEAERAIWARQAAGRRGPGQCSPELWSEFVGHYERFTDALCSGAKDGCTSSVERDYATAKRWFERHYAVVATRIRPYLDVEFSAEVAVGANPRLSATGVSKIADYSGHKRENDALEILFRAPTLREMLRRDSGDLIPRIARISEAVYRCHASFDAQ